MCNSPVGEGANRTRTLFNFVHLSYMLKERGKPLLKLIDDIPRCSRVVDKIHHEVENNQKNQQDGKALEESFPYEEKLASNLDFLLAHLLLKCFGALYALIAAK